MSGTPKLLQIKNLVTVDNFHVEVPKYIHENKVIIENYDDMCDVIVNMLRSNIFFNIEKNQLKDMVDDLVFIYNPACEDNEARVKNLLCDDSDSESDEEETEEEFRCSEIKD